MALRRDSGPAPQDMRLTSATLADIGRLLRLAREQAGLSLDEAATGAGVSRADAEAFESGAMGDLHDRVETLRALRAYADSIELPGGDYALAVINLWPPVHQLPTRAP